MDFPSLHPTPSELAAVTALLATLSVGDEMVIAFRRVPIVSFDSGRAPTSPVPSVLLSAVTSAPRSAAQPLTGGQPAVPPTEVPAAPVAEPPFPDSPLGRARRIAAETPDLALRVRGWARQIGYSERELGRARKAGAMRHARRGTTRGHNGLLVTVAEVVGYLELVEAVERGEKPAPRWYANVRRPR